MHIARQNARRARKRAAEVAGPVSREIYIAIRAEGECVYCGQPSEHVDHVRPLARGGWEHESNLVPACAACNGSKNARLLTEWRSDRVEYGVLHSAKVAAELDRLMRGGDEPMESFIPDEPTTVPAPFSESGTIDPDCRNGKHQTCIGDGCSCSCHVWEVELDPELVELLTTD